MKELPVRKNIRLQGYDYSGAGYYFVTFCIKDGHALLWQPPHVGARIARPRPSNAPPQLSDVGIIVETAIENIPATYSNVEIDKYVIMPNHIHLIVVIQENHGRAMRAPTIAQIINQMKGYASKQIGYSIWQKSYHDHILRDEAEYRRVWQYIDQNPATWTEDDYYTPEADTLRQHRTQQKNKNAPIRRTILIESGACLCYTFG